MQVLEAKNDGSKKESKPENKSATQEVMNFLFNNPEHFKKIQEQINNAFSEAEHQNDDMVSKVNEKMMNQAITSILRAEEQNDDTINKIIHSIAKKSDKSVDPVLELGLLSSDMAQLR
jgi:transcription termination factor NusB